MNKEQIVQELSERCGFVRGDVSYIVDSFLDLISEELVKERKVRLVGFGAFSVRTRAARKGRNPSTGEDMLLPETVTPIFTPGKGLKDAVKGR